MGLKYLLNKISLKGDVVVYIVVRPAEIIVRKKGIFLMRERDLIFKLLRPDRYKIRRWSQSRACRF